MLWPRPVCKVKPERIGERMLCFLGDRGPARWSTVPGHTQVLEPAVVASLLPQWPFTPPPLSLPPVGDMSGWVDSVLWVYSQATSMWPGASCHLLWAARSLTDSLGLQVMFTLLTARPMMGIVTPGRRGKWGAGCRAEQHRPEEMQCDGYWRVSAWLGLGLDVALLLWRNLVTTCRL